MMLPATFLLAQLLFLLWGMRLVLFLSSPRWQSRIFCRRNLKYNTMVTVSAKYHHPPVPALTCSPCLSWPAAPAPASRTAWTCSSAWPRSSPTWGRPRDMCGQSEARVMSANQRPRFYRISHQDHRSHITQCTHDLPAADHRARAPGCSPVSRPQLWPDNKSFFYVKGSVFTWPTCSFCQQEAPLCPWWGPPGRRHSPSQDPLWERWSLRVATGARWKGN